MNIVGGLYQATEGGVILQGKEVNEPGPDRAIVFQNHALFPWLTCYQNVELAVKSVFGKTRNRQQIRDWTLHNLELVHNNLLMYHHNYLYSLELLFDFHL